MKKSKYTHRCTCKVLSYHRILPAARVSEQVTQRSLIVTAESFRRQMTYVKQQYHLLTMDELAEALHSGDGFPEPSCSITFDDGWRDNYLYAFPILQELEIPATLFATANNVESGQEFWTEQLARLLYPIELKPENILILNKFLPMDSLGLNDVPRSEFINLATIAMKNRPLDEIEGMLAEMEKASFKRNYIRTERSMCSWSELKEMTNSGLIRIGSHTLSHAILTNECESRQKDEIFRSKKILEKKLNVPVLHFAYPNGNFDNPTEKMVRDAGYLSASTCLNGANTGDTSPFRVRRIHVFDRKDDGIAFSQLRFSVRISDLYQQLKRFRNSLLKQAY